MVAPWQDTPTRVVVEFKKSNSGAKRIVELSKKANEFPQQLYGRVDPMVWHGFIQELEGLAQRHPYTELPSASVCAHNCAALACLAVIGFGCFVPDGGDYGPWLQEVDAVLARNRPTFQHGGASLDRHYVHGIHMIHININPAVAVGAPVAMMAPPAAPGQPVMMMPQPGAPLMYPSAPPAGYPPQGPPPPKY